MKSFTLTSIHNKYHKDFTFEMIINSFSADIRDVHSIPVLT